MYLLDTNIWLWMVEEPQRLSAEIATIVKNADNYPFFLSAISVWEVAKKVSLGKPGLSIPVATARHHNLTILTADNLIRTYPHVKTI